MPLTSPGNDDDTGENHQPTLRKNTAEPAQQTLKQYKHDTRLWRFIRHYVDEARLYEDYTGVEAIGIDETSRKGHRLFVFN